MKKKLLIILPVVVVLGLGSFFGIGAATGLFHKHAYNSQIIAPTCSEQGYTSFVCKCGEEYKDNYTETIPHEYSDEWTTDVEATCKTEGSKSRHCNKCGSMIDVTPIEKFAHDFSDEWTTDVEPTCKSEGSKSRHCKHCNEKIDVITLNLVDHEYNDGVCIYCGKKLPPLATNLTYKLGNDGSYYKVLNIGTEKREKFTIPSVYNDKPVIGIEEYAFSGCSNITEIVIPKSITSIDSFAFVDCSSLSKITIPNSVEAIGNFVFVDCKALSEIVVPNSVRTIGEGVFNGCSSLKNLTIPFIGKSRSSDYNSTRYPFGYLFGTSSYDGAELTYQEYFTTEGYTTSTNYYIPTLLKSVTITGGTDLPYGSFYNCQNITDITMSDSIYKIGDYAFSNCDSLKNIVLPKNLTSIGEYAFDSCTEFESISIPENVTHIGKNAFMYCRSLTTITWNAKNCTIAEDDDSSLFSNDNYNYIHTVVLGESVEVLPLNAFSFCKNLTEVFWNASNCISAGKKSKSAFFGCSSLSKIIMGDNVKTIPDYAFAGLENLTELSVPNSITSIGVDVFYECDNLKYNEIDNAYYIGNTDNKSVILIKSATDTVTDCVIDTQTKIIYNDAFNNCTTLQRIELSDGVVTIGQNAFNNCTALKTVIGGKNLQTVGDNAFYGCNKLEAITFYDNIKSVGTSAFRGCSELKTAVVGKNCTYIGFNAFYGCNKLEEITIPFVGESINSTENNYFSFIFGSKTFYNSDEYLPSTLKSVTITGGTQIASWAFYLCEYLTDITIPSSIVEIYENAFHSCNSLKNVYISDIAAWCNIKFSDLNSNPLNYAENLYLNDVLVTELVVPDTVTSIGQYAFSKYDKLKKITIPESVTAIEQDAFTDCKLESINITSIATWCKLDCVDNPLLYANTLLLNNEPLKGEISLPEGLTYIRSCLFKNCNEITSIVIPNSVTEMNKNAFIGLTSLTSITLPFIGAQRESDEDAYFGYLFGANPYTDSKTSIPTSLHTVVLTDTSNIYASTFYNCSGLTSITIPDSVTFIGKNAFYGCSGLKSITIPDGVTSIGNSAFRDCGGLTSITIPNGITSIGNNTYYGCSGLTSITIPDSVTSIGNSAFRDCSGLTSITIPDSVASIGENAFYGCPIEVATIPTIAIPFIKNANLKTVTITSGTSIGSSAFQDCSKLTSITIPDSVASIGENAFYGCPIEVATIPTIAIPYIKNANLKTVTITSGTSIGYNAFWNCSKLTSITIPDSVTSIEDFAFNGCNNLKYNEYDNAYYLGNDNNPYVILVKAKDTSITSCTINDKTKFIHSSAFFNCSGLESVTIGNSVTSIGDYAFYYCSRLTKIDFNGTKAQWNAISKSYSWKDNTGSFTVYCTDGTISKSNA